MNVFIIGREPPKDFELIVTGSDLCFKTCQFDSDYEAVTVSDVLSSIGAKSTDRA